MTTDAPAVAMKADEATVERVARALFAFDNYDTESPTHKQMHNASVDYWLLNPDECDRETSKSYWRMARAALAALPAPQTEALPADVYEVDDGFVVAADGTWMPGVFPTREAALQSVRPQTEALVKLREGDAIVVTAHGTDIKVAAIFLRFVEGWVECRFADDSTSICRPSNVTTLRAGGQHD